mmetsp:Transcript_9394/g.36666  ORF Transcript_9394/g.36666 Transcript_9394/m.36666 type:complete len:269 (-) Transcript_9394:17-823(-)
MRCLTAASCARLTRSSSAVTRKWSSLRRANSPKPPDPPDASALLNWPRMSASAALSVATSRPCSSMCSRAEPSDAMRVSLSARRASASSTSFSNSAFHLARPSRSSTRLCSRSRSRSRRRDTSSSTSERSRSRRDAAASSSSESMRRRSRSAVSRSSSASRRAARTCASRSLLDAPTSPGLALASSSRSRTRCSALRRLARSSSKSSSRSRSLRSASRLPPASRSAAAWSSSERASRSFSLFTSATSCGTLGSSSSEEPSPSPSPARP